MGRLGEESSTLHLSWYLLKVNFTLYLHFSSQNAKLSRRPLYPKQEDAQLLESLPSVTTVFTPLARDFFT